MSARPRASERVAMVLESGSAAGLEQGSPRPERPVLEEDRLDRALEPAPLQVADLARFALDAEDLPRVTSSLWLGDWVRRALLSLVGGPTACFSGRDAEGRLLEGHRHASFLAEDLDGDGRIDHLTIHAVGGLGRVEQDAIGRLVWLARPGRGPDLRLVLLYLGKGRDLPRAAAGIAGEADTWISATPFVLVRHPKKNGRDGPEEQVQLELERRGLPRSIEITRLDRLILPSGTISWSRFRRSRPEQRAPVSARSGPNCFGFRIRFDQQVRGPLALGFGSHFGLGVFRPVARTRSRAGAWWW